MMPAPADRVAIRTAARLPDTDTGTRRRVWLGPFLAGDQIDSLTFYVRGVDAMSTGIFVRAALSGAPAASDDEFDAIPWQFFDSPVLVPVDLTGSPRLIPLHMIPDQVTRYLTIDVIGDPAGGDGSFVGSVACKIFRAHQ